MKPEEEGLKTPKGRLTDKGAAYIHKRRGEKATYQQIAAELQVCITTVYNAAKSRTHAAEKK